MRYKKLRIHFDGACDNRSKLKLMGAGIAVYLDGCFKYGKGKDFGGMGTSNISEYKGLEMSLLEAIRIAKEDVSSGLKVIIVGDSQLVIYQMQGKYKVKNETLKDLYETVKILEVQLKAISNVASLEYQWVRRERNQKADDYSKLGLGKNY